MVVKRYRWSNETFVEEVTENGAESGADIVVAARPLVQTLHVGQLHQLDGTFLRRDVVGRVACVGTRFAVFAFNDQKDIKNFNQLSK